MSKNETKGIEIRKQDKNEISFELDNPIKIPENHGVVIHLNSERDITELKITKDESYPEIHANCHAPAELRNVRLLHGGGSGVAVFGGYSPQLETELVMKHGGHKDTLEVMSLALIGDELSQREANIDDSQNAYQFMKSRIPEFVMVYMSPFHLRDRGKELWSTLSQGKVKRKLSFIVSMIISMNMHRSKRSNLTDSTTTVDSMCVSSTEENENKLHDLHSSGLKAVLSKQDAQKQHYTRRQSLHDSLKVVKDEKTPRAIYVNAISFKDKRRDLLLDTQLDRVTISMVGLQPNGDIIPPISNYETLRNLSKNLITQQKINKWKITLAQKAIGGNNPQNTAYVLTSGALTPELFTVLITEFTQVIHYLQLLTYSHESNVDYNIFHSELEELTNSQDVTKVSHDLNAHVGGCIYKNYLPKKGRFFKLRQLGHSFFIQCTSLHYDHHHDDSSSSLWLTPQEHIPAYFLGKLLQKHSDLSEIFKYDFSTISAGTNSTKSICALDIMEDKWLNIIKHALSIKSKQIIWTCGLTDAGLHNSFISKERGLELFDLGTPTCMPLPAFLTKFLMSFFHVFGMQDTINYTKNTNTWVRRFTVTSDSKLELDEQIKSQLSYIYSHFNNALEHFTKNLFFPGISTKETSTKTRELCIQYVVLQLLSDASFCLSRWEQKGGGSERYGYCMNLNLEKWLWRCLWDLFIASHVCSSYNVNDMLQ